MTQLVFALVVTLGGQTISTEYWSGIDTRLWYAKRLNSQHYHVYHRHHPKNRASTRSVYPGGSTLAPSRYSTRAARRSPKHSPASRW